MEAAMTGRQDVDEHANDRTRLPKDDKDEENVLSRSKLGEEDAEGIKGADDDHALSRSKLGHSDDGGRKGQGGMRDPDRTSDPGKLKPS
jgi:hypothetical protein